MKRTVLCLAVIAAAVAGAYHGILDNDFTNWDDDKFIVENPAIREFSLDNLGRICSTCLEGSQGPLPFLSFTLEHAAGGLDPRVFHATSLVLHVLASWVLFLLLRRLGLGVFGGLVAALLFALHPQRVESVAWAAQRKDLLCALFFFSAMYFYQGYLVTRARSAYALSLAACLLALASKSMAVTLPAVLLLQDFLIYRKLSRRLVIEKLPFIVPALVMAVLTWQAQRHAMPATGALSLWEGVLIAVRGVAFYMLKLVWPIGLSPFYPYPERIAFLEPEFLASIAAVIVLGAAAVHFGRRSRYVAFGALFFAVTILPVLQIVPVGSAAAADRYTYIPAAGICFIAGDLLTRLAVRVQSSRGTTATTAVMLAAAVVILVLGMDARKQCRVWRDSETLWRHVIDRTPDVALAHYQLGKARSARGDLAGALASYERAVELDPRDSAARNNLAYVLRLQGELDAAERECRAALRLDPELWEAHLNLAFILGSRARYAESLEAARSSLELNAASPDAHYVVGLSLYHLGRFEEAIDPLTRAEELDPALGDAVARVRERIAKEKAP